jgi:hypothetical protein
MEAEQRDSFKSRNLQARKQCKEEQRQAQGAMVAEHESNELKWASERDVKEYRKQMRAERPKSLASRNKGARHAEVMLELRNLAQEKKAESFMLKWAGENDTKTYIKQLAADGRKSLQFRAKVAKEHQMFEEEQHTKAVESALAEGALQSECKHCFTSDVVVQTEIC